MFRAGVLATAIAMIGLAGLGFVGMMVSISPVVWVMVAAALFCSITGLVFWGVNGGSHPMD